MIKSIFRWKRGGALSCDLTQVFSLALGTDPSRTKSVFHVRNKGIRKKSKSLATGKLRTSKRGRCSPSTWRHFREKKEAVFPPSHLRKPEKRVYQPVQQEMPFRQKRKEEVQRTTQETHNSCIRGNLGGEVTAKLLVRARNFHLWGGKKVKKKSKLCRQGHETRGGEKCATCNAQTTRPGKGNIINYGESEEGGERWQQPAMTKNLKK